MYVVNQAAPPQYLTEDATSRLRFVRSRSLTCCWPTSGWRTAANELNATQSRQLSHIDKVNQPFTSAYL